VEHLFRYAAEQADIAPLRNEDFASNESTSGLLMPRLIAEQRRILAMPAEGDQISKRLAAVVGTLRNLLQGADLAVCESELDAAAAEAAAARSAAPLVALLDRINPPESLVPAAVLSAAPAAEEPATDARPAMRVLKVDQARIDSLMNLIGELVVSKNALPFLARRAEEVHGSRIMAREIKDQYAVIDRLAQEMQEAIMQVRMIPVSEVFDRFPRLVRDLARKLAKKIELVVEGEDTAADKNIIEALGDPLLHIVRNAIDHGVERPDERRAAGKREHATISLAAWQEGDQVVIEVTDDGTGIDPACIRRSAIAKGVIDGEQAARLSDQEAVNLVFHAGFSTARQVSDLSGRGVGMDVVRTTINRLGGRVGVTSRPGTGTRVRLSLPLSMAITRVMLVEAGGTLFGIPMDIIAETVRVPFSSIRSIKRVQTFVLRNAVVPLVRLADLLSMTAQRAQSEAEAVLVVRLGDGSAGLVVDRFRESMDVILKPLDGMLSGMPGYAGTALLGDGRVLLVLNLRELL
jgi:two-component system chemotaxis sensor kinase CheA